MDPGASQAIADLIWVMQSPSLLSQSLNHPFHPSVSDEWCRSQLRRALRSGRVDALARDPAPLLEHLAARRSKTRLGIYFESLVEFWLRYLIDGVRDVRTEIQVYEGKETIGAYDFLFYDEREAQLKHWEVAIKYYLYVPRGTSVAPSAHTHAHTHAHTQVQETRKLDSHESLVCDREAFYGPQTLDRLHFKLDKMLNQQIPLGKRVGASSEMLMKGILFYPFDQYRDYECPEEVSTTHTRGGWLHLRDFASREWSNEEFFQLERLDYMNALLCDAPKKIDDLKQAFASSDESVHLLMRSKSNPKKSFRLYLVKDGWPYS